MEVRRFKDLLAIKEAQNIWGFHAYNLEVAELTEELWSALGSATSLRAQPELWQELETWNAEISPDTQDAPLTKAGFIKKLSLNIAQICNLKCTYCAAGGDGTYGSPVTKIDLSKAQQQIQFFLAKYSAQATEKTADEAFHIQFLGGEPLLYPSVIRELCQYAQLCVAGTSAQVAFSVTTNGTLITPRVADMLAEFNFSVAVSIDGDKETNEASRPAKGSSGEGSTVMTLRGIQELQRVRSQLRALKVNSVFGQHNMKISAAYDFLTQLDMDWDEINFLYANNEQDDEQTRLYIEEMRQVAQTAYSRGGLTALAKIRPFRDTLARIAARTRIHNYCGAGKSFLQADTRGDIYTCNWFMNDASEKVGSGVNLDADKLVSYEKSLIELNKCESCWARHLCGGGCMAVHKAKTGERHSKDANFCARTRELAATALNFYAQNLNNDN